MVESIKNYVSYKNALKLKQIGFNEPCNMLYCKTCTLREDIMKKYHGLSDDVYLDLLESNGGSYKESDLYESKLELIPFKNCKNEQSNIKEDECTCPTIYDVMNWLITQHNCYIQIIYEPYPDDVAILVQILFYNSNKFGYWANNSTGLYNTGFTRLHLSEALNFAINLAIERIQKNK